MKFRVILRFTIGNKNKEINERTETPTSESSKFREKGKCLSAKGLPITEKIFLYKS